MQKLSPNRFHREVISGADQSLSTGKELDRASKGTIQSGQRMVAILDFLAESPHPASITEISAGLDLPPSTVHRLLATLVAGGLVDQRDDRRYDLGVKLISLGRMAEERLDLRQVALETMRNLSRETRLEVNLAQLDGDSVIYLAKINEGAPFSLNVRIGQRMPAYCRALGKVLLAALPEDDARRRIGTQLERLTPHTITDPDALLDHLAAVRRQGYAVDREEAALGCVCFAAPIRDMRGKVAAALSVAGPTGQIATFPEAELVQKVKDAAGEVSRKLGFTEN